MLVEQAQHLHRHPGPVVDGELDDVSGHGRALGADGTQDAWAARLASCASARPTSSTVAPRSDLSWVGSALGDHAAVVDHGDLVGEGVGLLEVLRGEQDARALLDEVLDHRPQVDPTLGIEPGGGLVEEQHLGSCYQRGGDVEAPTHAAGVGLEGPVTGVGEPELLEQLDGPCGDDGAVQMVEAPDHGEVLPTREVLVHRRVLTGQSDQGPDLLGLGHHVVPEDVAGAARRG